MDDDDTADDCDGHGTHVSATVAGLQVGVAKGAKVVAVRILDCSGSGTISNTVAALDWVAANARRPAVVTLSLGIQVRTPIACSPWRCPKPPQRLHQHKTINTRCMCRRWARGRACWRTRCGR